ncbi:hypothetical protein L1987_33872 [Smallanthus sonchifolius]|uniref:Uncharacterized protein n=1 Tax=Smallanthus sonchifolius TaxID=185202 RepID=A0ACB9HTM4_9ASTR|nr:hypothetical protein L1987_33872 [Smallanthus sonchifolius]
MVVVVSSLTWGERVNYETPIFGEGWREDEWVKDKAMSLLPLSQKSRLSSTNNACGWTSALGDRNSLTEIPSPPRTVHVDRLSHWATAKPLANLLHVGGPSLSPRPTNVRELFIVDARHS